MTSPPSTPDIPVAGDPEAGNLAEEKKALREVQARLREEAGMRHPDAADGLAGRADAVLELGGPGRVVAGYWPIRSEISPLPLMAALARAGMETALPATPRPGERLTFHAWTEGDALVQGHYGVPGPSPNAPGAGPALLLVPLLAFDDGCHRLGYGGGYYDRTLAALRSGNPGIKAVGLAYDEQRVDRVPGGDHDMRLDAVLTPTELLPAPGAVQAGRA